MVRAHYRPRVEYKFPTGSWCSWLTRWPVKPEIAGSSPVGPAMQKGLQHSHARNPFLLVPNFYEIKRMFKTCLLVLVLFPLAALPQSPSSFTVQIEIFADSSNQLSAHVQVDPNTDARDLMERFFKIEYMDFTKRFVVGIAGFKASAKEKKFWKLEIDGLNSQVGIAEVVIKRNTRLRWSVASF